MDLDLDRSMHVWDNWLNIWNGKPKNSEHIVADNLTVHIPKFGMPPSDSIRTRNDFISWVAGFRKRFNQSALFEIEIGPFINKDTTASRWRFTGKSPDRNGVWREVTMCGVDILRINECGQICEYWLSDDLADIYADLDMLSIASS